MDEPHQDDRRSDGTGWTPLVVLTVAVLVVWVLVTGLIYWAFSNWSERSDVGSSFGAVSALFSGLAFAGVVYALNLQRKEMSSQRFDMIEAQRISRDQLTEMREAREVQGQSLPLPSATTAWIEKPRFFYSPPEDRHSAQSRYFVEVALENPTDYPALNVNVRCVVQLSNDTILNAVDEFLAIVPPRGEPQQSAASFMYVNDETGDFFEAVRQNDPRKLPLIHVLVLFKSVTGGHFRLSQVFRIYASGDDSEPLSLWHSAITGFKARFKTQVATLKEHRRRHQQSEWDQLFETVEGQFAQSLGNSQKIDLLVHPLPGHFRVDKISRQDFEADMQAASYSQLVSTLYDCPAELDSRTN